MSPKSLKILLPNSLVRKIKTIREAVLKCCGSYESVLELGGMVRNGLVIITDALIPKAKLQYCSFRVEARDLSACWSETEKNERTRHLKPVGDLHHHPPGGTGYCGSTYRGPQASQVDKDNSLQLASLFHPFNLQEFTSEEVVEQVSPLPGEKIRCYNIDKYTSVGFQASVDPMENSKLEVTRRKMISYWASLIASFDGDSRYIRANVVEHAYCVGFELEPKVSVHEDVPIVVLKDEAVARLTDWPIEKIRLEIDPAEIEKEVRLKYETSGYYWGRHPSSPSYEICDSAYGSTHPAASAGRDEGYLLPQYAGRQQDPGRLLYLQEESGAFDVANILLEAALLLNGERRAGLNFRHLRESSQKSEVLKALEECLWWLNSSGNGREV